jgi:hypothetical protein
MSVWVVDLCDIDEQGEMYNDGIVSIMIPASRWQGHESLYQLYLQIIIILCTQLINNGTFFHYNVRNAFFLQCMRIKNF